MASLVERVAAAVPARRVSEAAGSRLPAVRHAVGPAQLPNRSGFVQGVPTGGVDTNDLTQGAATTTSRSDLLQELWEEYLKCPPAFACVNAIARTVTAGGLVMKWDADTGVFGQKLPEKPPAVVAFERLIAFCNPTQDIRQLCRNIVADLQVFGDAFLEVVWYAGIPVALYNQDVPTTFPKTDEHGKVTGYKQVTEYGQTATFKPHQIIHFSLDSARPGMLGVSPTHAAEESIVAWMFLHACEKEAARRGLPPNVHADLAAGTPETEVRKWQDQYQSRNIGPSNMGTPIVTKGGGKVTELQTAKLTDILAAKKDERDTIIATYSVPPAKIGIIESGNLGGGTGNDQNKTFVLDIVKPIALLISEKLQFHLAVQAFGVQGWHTEFAIMDYRDDMIVANIQDQQVRLGARTLNDLRRELGRPPVDGGDDAVLVARQDIVLWSDMADRSAASVAALGGGTPTPAKARKPGPPPATGTMPSRGTGGSPSATAGPPSESVRAVAEALAQLFASSGLVAEHTPKLGVRQRVWNQLSGNFPPSAIKWVLDPDVSTSWDGPVHIPPAQIDTHDEDEWNAKIDRAKVARIKKHYRRRGKMKPAVVVRGPGHDKDIIADGHHHVMAALELGIPIKAYVGHVSTMHGPWDTMSTRQRKARKTRESVNYRPMTKAEVDYAPAAAPGMRCGTCEMFSDDRCSLVAGDINPAYVCSQWRPGTTAAGAP